MYKINVLIVTYKQADVIGRNLESILQQKEYGLNKIIVCDDCSPDNNWEVIQSYVKKYPEYIEAYRNDPNLGIYGNSNKVMSLRGDADFYCWLEGDDALCDGFFKATQEYLDNNKVDISVPIALMSNFIIRYDNKEDIIDLRNSVVNRNKDYFGLYLRGLISWRASLFSAAVTSQFQPAVLDRGLGLAESSFDNQFFRYLKDAKYIPINGSVYYAGIGVSVNLMGEKTEYRTTEGIVQWDYYIDNLVHKKDDVCWCKANKQKCQFLMKPSLILFFKMTYNYTLGCLLTYKVSKRILTSFWGPIFRRLMIR